MICIFLHIYYPDSLAGLLVQLRPFLKSGHYLLVNLVWDNHTERPVLTEAGNIILIRSANKGKDIGGKLALLDLYLRLGLKSDYMLFLHDKKSPHSATGSFWRTELYKIIDKERTAAIVSLFQHKKNIGMVGSKNFIKNEWEARSGTFLTTNNTILLSLIKTYGFALPDYSFLAGTMFWVRSALYEDFFSRHAPLQIRASLEPDNVLDTDEGRFTHAWERLFSWIVLEKKYKIAGI